MEVSEYECVLVNFVDLMNEVCDVVWLFVYCKCILIDDVLCCDDMIVYGDFVLLLCVLINLLDNVIKYSLLLMSIECWVELGVDGWVVYCMIWDCGCGISYMD